LLNSDNAFQRVKEYLAQVILLAFPDSKATLSLQMDASNKKIDAVSQQRSNEMLQPLSFFSFKEGNLLLRKQDST